MADHCTRAARTLVDVLFDDAGLGRCLVAPDGTILRVNAEWLRSTGVSAEQVVGEDVVALFPATRDMALAMHSRARAGHRVEVPRYAQAVNGRETWWEGSIAPVELEGGTGLLITAREVTGRPRDAEEALRDIAARNEAMLAHSGAMAHLGAWWIDVAQQTDVNANPLRWSDEVFRIFGYEPGEVPVTNELFFRHVHPEDRARVADAMAKALASRTRYELAHRLIRRDGTERVVVERGEGRYDGSGRLVQILGAVQDVTEQKRAEAELRRAMERHAQQVRLFDGVASTTPDFVYLFDREGRFLYANRRLLEVWGMPLCEVVGKTCRELGYEQWHHDLHMREIAQVIASRQPIKGEVPFRAPLTGIFGVYEYIFTPVLGADGAVEIVAGTTRDVTDRKRAEEALRDADRRKDEFLGMLSHELRNPLAPIRNSTYILQRAPPGSEQARRAQDVIVRQTEHLTRLVDDLLDITRIARGKIELRRSRLDLRDVVSRAADDFRVLLHDRCVRFEVVLPDRKLWADADATRITQVVGNLLHNASKFTRRGDTVTLTVGEAERTAEIRVRDTGAGIDPELLGRIFDPFVQGERTLARTDGGLGLGLALVKGITELHGGSVRVGSAGQGKGSEFVVRLPLLSSLDAASPPPPRAERRRGRHSVLVVDDNADAAESLAEIVRLLGHGAEVAYDGRTALERARTGAPTVVLCDLGLPGMSGYDVARALREELPRRLRLIAVSGYAQPEDVQRALDAGFDGHVAKPCDPEKVERLLGWA
jgi:PAS domain S-box-containing protein